MGSQQMGSHPMRLHRAAQDPLVRTPREDCRPNAARRVRCSWPEATSKVTSWERGARSRRHKTAAGTLVAPEGVLRAEAARAAAAVLMTSVIAAEVGEMVRGLGANLGAHLPPPPRLQPQRLPPRQPLPRQPLLLLPAPLLPFQPPPAAPALSLPLPRPPSLSPPPPPSSSLLPHLPLLPLPLLPPLPPLPLPSPPLS